jgi:hypothetical protein
MSNNNVINFKKVKKERIKSGQERAPHLTKRKKDFAPNSETIKLWRFSLEIDEIIKSAIANYQLSTEEVAAVLANRVGHLSGFAKDPQKLSEFCQSVIERMNPKNLDPKNKVS